MWLKEYFFRNYGSIKKYTFFAWKDCKKCKNLHETANVASIWAGNQHGDLFFKVLFKNNPPGA